jgi:microcystin-dependent protein
MAVPNQFGDFTSGASVISPILTGSIVMYPSASFPSGWVLCDGSGYSISDPVYQNLFHVIGNSFNTPSTPSGFFAVPDLMDRTPVGFGNIDPNIDISAGFAVKDGSGGIIINIEALPPHSHQVLNWINGSVNSTAGVFQSMGINNVNQIGQFNLLDKNGIVINNQLPVQVINPYIHLKYIIKL